MLYELKMGDFIDAKNFRFRQSIHKSFHLDVWLHVKDWQNEHQFLLVKNVFLNAASFCRRNFICGKFWANCLHWIIKNEFTYIYISLNYCQLKFACLFIFVLINYFSFSFSTLFSLRVFLTFSHSPSFFLIFFLPFLFLFSRLFFPSSFLSIFPYFLLSLLMIFVGLYCSFALNYSFFSSIFFFTLMITLFASFFSDFLSLSLSLSLSVSLPFFRWMISFFSLLSFYT